MKINVELAFPIEIGQGWRRMTITNFKNLVNGYHYLNDEIFKHKNTEKNAHNSNQIVYRNTTVTQALDSLKKDFDNIVLGSTKENSVEIRDSRNDINGVRHDTLGSRLREDFSSVESQINETLKAHTQKENLGGSYKSHNGFYVNEQELETLTVSVESNQLITIPFYKVNGKASKLFIEQPTIAERIPVMNRRAGQQLFETKNGNTYVAYGVDGDKVLYFERFDEFGNYKDRMRLETTGHGSSFFVTTEDGQDYIWTNFDIANIFNFVKTPYKKGTVTQNNLEGIFYDTFYHSARPYACLDEEGDKIAFIYTITNGHMVETRNFKEWKQGINNVVGRFEIYSDSKYQPHQSIDIIDDMIFWNYGSSTSSPDDKKSGVVVFDLDGNIITDKTIKQSPLFPFDTFNRFEPEGIQVKRTKVPYVYDLVIGYAAGNAHSSSNTHLAYYKTTSKVLGTPIINTNDKFDITIGRNGFSSKVNIFGKETRATGYLSTDPRITYFKVDYGENFKGSERGLTESEVRTMINQAINSSRLHYRKKVIFEGSATGIGKTYKLNGRGSLNDFDTIKIYWKSDKTNREVTIIDNWQRNAQSVVLHYTNVADDVQYPVAEIYECGLSFNNGDASFTINRDVHRDLNLNENISQTHFIITRIEGINE